MRRADRLFQIVQYLRGGRLLTARNLAERLEVSERTIYRDIADLIGSGVPIEGESGVGYLMRAGYDLPPLMFTRAEMVAMVAGARLIRAWGGLAMAQAAEEALVKIGAVLPDEDSRRAENIQVHAMAIGISDDQRRMIDRLEAAVEGRLCLDIIYRDMNDTKSERRIRPLGLWFWGKVWTLIAWCEMRGDFRMFRTDRMEGVTDGPYFRSERDKSLTAFYVKQRALGLPDAIH